MSFVMRSNLLRAGVTQVVKSWLSGMAHLCFNNQEKLKVVQQSGLWRLYDCQSNTDDIKHYICRCGLPWQQTMSAQMSIDSGLNADSPSAIIKYVLLQASRPHISQIPARQRMVKHLLQCHHKCQIKSAEICKDLCKDVVFIWMGWPGNIMP